MSGWSHPHGDRRVLFDREADRYDRSRPGYPAALVDAVLGPSPQGLAVLDVACGTGIAARLLAARGAAVLGVELNPGMAEVAARHGIPVEVDAFETWDAAGRSFDRVTCAQAWHWLDQDAAARRAADLLRPGGRLCLIWSIGLHPAPLAAALEDAYRRAGAEQITVGYGADRADDPDAAIAVVVEGLRSTGRFAAPEVRWFPWTRRYTRDAWLDQILSHSDHIALPPEQRQRVLAEVGAAIDAYGGGFAMDYRSVLIAAEPL
jgi:SAM-dependent methyltransferase